jgi:hypothetical protein
MHGGQDHTVTQNDIQIVNDDKKKNEFNSQIEDVLFF